MDSGNTYLPPAGNPVKAVYTQSIPAVASSSAPVAVNVTPVTAYPIAEGTYPQQVYYSSQVTPPIPTAGYVNPQMVPASSNYPPYPVAVSASHGVVSRPPNNVLPKYLMSNTNSMKS